RPAPGRTPRPLAAAVPGCSADLPTARVHAGAFAPLPARVSVPDESGRHVIGHHKKQPVFAVLPAWWPDAPCLPRLWHGRPGCGLCPLPVTGIALLAGFFPRRWFPRSMPANATPGAPLSAAAPLLCTACIFRHWQLVVQAWT